ncbi:hypothetical protein [Roseomonas xinghualingensis]|uniref:hypothetical protein n=1 Tax=Roseomonas xinghualingensis TaxID=2986475 RepID=UPI0021F1E232|nr:hypothetical protein [Roseomonas sp. SXEYE001]MCV4209832.1 hypothetical protein [Roseomonas sp. SXEYE001]MCV4210179.1 hypothetical protein [Roseomonas sp. SXEYE001]
MFAKPPHSAQDVPETLEIRISKEGPGRGTWRWSIWRGTTLVRRAPASFSGAEAAYEAGRRVLNR